MEVSRQDLRDALKVKVGGEMVLSLQTDYRSLYRDPSDIKAALIFEKLK